MFVERFVENQTGEYIPVENQFVSWDNLIDLYEAWNDPEKANEWRAKLLQKETLEERNITTYMATFSCPRKH